MAATVIVAVLASVAIPLGQYTTKRGHEVELRQRLRELRTAIDNFHRDWERDGAQLIGALCVKNKTACGESASPAGYPKSLSVLLGVQLTGGESSVRDAPVVRRYLRRIPIDPMLGTAEWGLRCYRDPREQRDWCKEDVFDVFSRSDGQALDDTRYREW
jgi:general secretion pathway protein G